MPTPLKFVLTKFNSSATVISASLEAGITVQLTDVSAIGVVRVPLQMLKSTFKVILDACAGKHKYYVYDASFSPAIFTELSNNITFINAMMDASGTNLATGTNGAIKTVASGDIDKNDRYNLLPNDFMYYLSNQLLGTAPSSTINNSIPFINKSNIINDIRTNAGADISRNTYEFLSKVGISATPPPGNNEYYTWQSSIAPYHYLDASGYTLSSTAQPSVLDGSNICRALYKQMLNDGGRFTKDATTYNSFYSYPGNTISIPQELPFIEGDSISFRLSLSANANQKTNVGQTGTIPTRVYEIRLIAIANKSSSYNGIYNNDASYNTIPLPITSAF